MSARFTVLASGSAGNAALLQCDGFGLLIDCGLGERHLGRRLKARGLAWRDVHAAILTHTHGDHCHETAMSALARHGVPFYCHPEHAACLVATSDAFGRIHAARLARWYQPGQWLSLAAMKLLPVGVSHDGGPCCAFRFEGPESLFGPAWSIGYAADLGCWDDALARTLADVDVLAVEFNHDEDMQRTSRRPGYLKARVLGDRGHLSNRQAVELLLATREHSARACLQYVVLLHRSRECNTAALARAAAEGLLNGDCDQVCVILAEQHEPTETLVIGCAANDPKRARSPKRVRVINGRSSLGMFDSSS
jgi:phosphoribosyl 1,2-cyclic phosphodiesterase